MTNEQADGEYISIKDVHSVLHNHMFDNAHRPSIYAELNRISKELDGLSVAIPNKVGHCKDCKYFEYDSIAKVDGIPFIVAHEICNKYGCKTKEDGYCFLWKGIER